MRKESKQNEKVLSSTSLRFPPFLRRDTFIYDFRKTKRNHRGIDFLFKRGIAVDNYFNFNDGRGFYILGNI